MQYQSTKRVTSKVDPTVTFVLKKMNVFRRDQLDEQKAPVRERMRPIEEELEPLDKAYREAHAAAVALVQPERSALITSGTSKEDADKQIPLGKINFPDGQFRQWVKLKDQLLKIDRSDLTPMAVRYVLVKIEGLEIDGEEGTLEKLLECGDDGLYQELALEVGRELGLDIEERLNLLLRSTSPAAEDGAKNTGVADLAGTPETTIPAAA